MKISTKIVAGFGVVIVMFLVAMGVYHTALRGTLSAYQGLFANQETMKSESARIGFEMLTARRGEKDFLMRKNPKYAEKVHEAIEQVVAHADALRALGARENSQEGVKAGEDILKHAAEYLTAFNGLTEAWQRRGLDHKSGLQGTFRDAAHQMESKWAQCEVTKLQIDLLQMRRYEKDFAMRKDEADAGRMKTLIATFREDLGRSAMNDRDKEEMLSRVSDYEATFEAFVDDTLGGAGIDETSTAFRDAAQAVENELASHYVPDAMKDYLMLRRHEKDYLLRLDTKYASKAEDVLNRLAANAAASALPDEAKQELATVLATYRESFQALVAEDQRIAALTSSMRDAVHKIEPIVEANIARSDEEMKTVAASTARTAESKATVALTAAGVALLLGALAAFLITRSITRPLERIITGLNEGADQVNDAASQVSSTSMQLAEGASEQASSLEETSSALEQMAAMTRTNAETAKEANTISCKARDAAQNGDQTMEQLNSAMVAINESSGQISKIIKVIEEIAFQTNLLALNAAVEAARAGEHGKGFAVVADEVRNLAQRAAEAARETTGLIEDSVGKAQEGTNVATEVGKALGTIVCDVTKVTELVDGVTKASEEQSQGVDQVNAAVSQIDKVTQQNASGAEESASAAEQLSAQSQTVKGMVNELTGMLRGKSHSGEVATTRTRGSGGAAGTAVQRRSNATMTHREETPKDQPGREPAHASGKPDFGEELMSLEDKKDLSDF